MLMKERPPIFDDDEPLGCRLLPTYLIPHEHNGKGIVPCWAGIPSKVGFQA